MLAELNAELAAWPSLDRIVASTIVAWPQHEAYLRRHFTERSQLELQRIEEFAQRLLIIIGGDLNEFVSDYHWMCGKMISTEYYYRRHGNSLYSNFGEVVSSIYANENEARRYMRGLMLSQVLWRQHAGALLFFIERFLPNLPHSSDYLEVGPGHGFWMAMAAAKDPDIRFTGLDISAESLVQTRNSLDRIGVRSHVSLEICDICDDYMPDSTFDVVVASQVLEIVSSPERALANLKLALKPNGRLFLNVPIRAAAPDHIRRWENTRVMMALLSAAGLTVCEMAEIGGRRGSIEATEGFSLLVIASRSV